MNPSYRYVLCDLLSDRVVAELPLSGVSFERRISRVGSLSGTLEATTPRLVDLARKLYDHTGRAALWVYRDGQLWWGGIPWTVSVGQAERGPVSLQVQAATFDSYAHRRVLRENRSYRNTDQGVIVPALWRHLQSDPRGNIGVVAEDQPTGVIRDRDYYGTDLATYGERIEQLGDVEGGPEHTIDTFLDGYGARVKRLRVGNRLGNPLPRAVFQRARSGGGRVLQWSEVADASDGGTLFQTRGDAATGNVGEDEEPLLSAVHEATDLLLAGWPLLDQTRDHPGATELSTLNGHAAAMRATQSGAPPVHGYHVQVGTTGWNPNRLGDMVRLKLADMWHQQSRDVLARPVACKVTAAQASTAESVELIFGGE